MRTHSVALLLMLLTLPGLALSHPHAWIDLRMQVLFDDSGRITALEQSWELDTMYSLVVLEQIQEESVGESLDEKFENFSRDMIRQLAKYDYMTRLRSAGKPVDVLAARDYRLEQVGGQLRLHFVLPLAEPLNPKVDPLSYAVFDPTFYIKVTHSRDGVQLRGASTHCRYDIKQPQPAAEVRERAGMLDKDEQTDSELGRHFAEHTEIRCTPAS